jgi:hypothetical protein
MFWSTRICAWGTFCAKRTQIIIPNVDSRGKLNCLFTQNQIFAGSQINIIALKTDLLKQSCSSVHDVSQF